MTDDPLINAGKEDRQKEGHEETVTSIVTMGRSTSAMNLNRPPIGFLPHKPWGGSLAILHLNRE